MSGIILFHIHLHGHFALKNNRWYDFTFEGKRSSVLINKIDTSLLIHDLFNYLDKETKAGALKNISPKYNPLEIRSRDGDDLMIQGNGINDAFTKPLGTLIQFGSKYQRVIKEKYISEVIGVVELSDIIKPKSRFRTN
ncbi:MAG TPA: hypothetical protein VFE32_21425 [Puia sp.]|nr:hypothetical protein [Puia sp.]